MGARRFERHFRSLKVRPDPLVEFVLGWLRRHPLPARDRYAPIVWDRDQNGYRFEAKEADEGHPYQLPGLWFSPTEAQALLTMEHLLHNLDPGLLGAHVEPLKARLTALLSAGDHSADEVRMAGQFLIHRQHMAR